ncbi:MAG: L-threonylcarbamoyladenylate synthase [candidate division WOR-3 bacterium]
MIETSILKITEKRIKKEKPAFAAKIIKEGGVVSFPTDTIYSLSTNALLPEAICKIYSLKQRCLSEPLPIFIWHREELKNYVKEIPKIAENLIEKYWPGPLTIVFYKKEGIFPEVLTAGSDKIAIRIPNTQIGLLILEVAKIPITGTSANISGGKTPIKAIDVIQNFYEKIDLIIDGGATLYKKESTIIDVTAKIPEILRLGVINEEEIKKIIGKVKVNLKKESELNFPFQIYIVPYENIKNFAKLIKEFLKKDKKVLILKSEENQDNFKNVEEIVYGSHKNPESFAINIFPILKKANNFDYIIIEGVKEEGIGISLNSLFRKIGKFLK